MRTEGVYFINCINVNETEVQGSLCSIYLLRPATFADRQRSQNAKEEGLTSANETEGTTGGRE